MINEEIQRRAEDLAESLAQSKEYIDLQEAMEALEQHEAAKIMLKDFREKQEALQQKIIAGEKPSESEIQEVQKSYELVSYNPYVRRVVEAEAVFSHTLAEIQRILAEAVGLDIPGSTEEGDAESGSDSHRRGGLRSVDGGGARSESPDGESTRKKGEDDGRPTRGRLWVPGQP